MKILKLEFKFDGDRKAFEETFNDAAEPIAETPGMKWKIWLWNDEERIGGGFYLFDNQSSIDDYLNGPIISGLKTAPVVSDAQIAVYDVVEKPTAITRGPVSAAVEA